MKFRFLSALTLATALCGTMSAGWAQQSPPTQKAVSSDTASPSFPQIMQFLQQHRQEGLLWSVRANMAGQLEDMLALRSATEFFAAPYPFDLDKFIQESLKTVDQAEKMGIDSSPLRKSIAGLKEQLVNSAITNRVVAIRLDAALGMYSKVLSEGGQLLPQVKEPDSRSHLLVGLVNAAFHMGDLALADQYLKQVDSREPLDRFQFGCPQLRLEMERNPDFSPALFLERCQTLWPLFQQIPVDKISRSVTASAASLYELSQRMALRLPPGSPDLEKIAVLSRDLLGQLDKRGQAEWSEPVLQNGTLNPKFSTWVVFDTLHARLDVAAYARKLGDYQTAQSQLDQVREFFPAMEKKLPELESAAKQIFLGCKVQPEARRGFFSRIPARYYEESGRLMMARAGHLDAASARKVLESLSQALNLYRRSGDSEPAVLALQPLCAVVAKDAGTANAQTLAQVEENLKISRERGLRRPLIESFLALGELKSALNRKAEAKIDLQQGLKLLEEYLVEQGGDSPLAADMRQQSRRSYELLARLETEGGGASEALSVLNRLQQASSQGSVNPTAPTNPKLAKALEQVRDSRIRLRSLETEGDRLRTTDAQASAQHTASVANTKAQFYNQMSELYRLNPEFEKLAIRPINLARVQKTLPDNTLVVQYFPTDTQLYIFVMDKSNLHTLQVPVSRGDLEKLSLAFRRSLLKYNQPTDKSGLNQSSFALYHDLIEPLEADLKGKEVLATIPTGILMYVPFAALAHPGSDGRPAYLAERLQTVSLMKSSDLEILGHSATGKADGKILAFGNPDGSLPSASLEVNSLLQLFKNALIYVEKQASKETLLKAAGPGISYLHFATHCVLDSTDPKANHLVMAGSDLSVNEVAGMSLGDDIRLVTLSACKTALGEDRPRSELLQSMADAFGYAGSPSVMASLWSVADDSTQTLMDEFYQQLKGGASRGLALQRAEIKLAHTKGHEHPFFWAPFVLMGDWR